MAEEVILVEGPSGAGKSTSLRNIPPATGIILSPNHKKLPWPGGDDAWGKRKMHVPSMDELLKIIPKIGEAAASNPDYCRTLILEDGTHYITERYKSTKFQMMNTGNAAFERYKNLAIDMMRVKEALDALPDTVIVVWIHHVEEEGGKIVFKVQGKLLRNEFDFVSYFRIVWHAMVTEATKPEDRFKFLLVNDGIHEAKTPIGMFNEQTVPNDLQPLLERVRQYNHPGQNATA